MAGSENILTKKNISLLSIIIYEDFYKKRLFGYIILINMIKYAHNTYNGRTQKDTVGRYIV